MKKSLNLFAVVLLIVLSAACNKNEKPLDPQEAEQVKVTYIRAEGGESSKASISDSDATFAWNTGDQIAVYADGYKISDGLSSTYNATNNATFSFSGANVVDENDRANFAVFPASLVYDSGSNLYDTDVTESSLKINLPSSYTLAQVQDEVSPVPMIATNVKDGDLAFKSICALVRVTAVNISKDADHIAVTFPGKKVQGEFTLTSVAPGTTGVVTANTDGTDDTITITDLGISSFTASLVLNVPVPSGVADSQEYNDIKVTVYDSGNHKINAITTPLKLSAGVPVAWAPSRKASRKVTATLPVFTVASGKKVVFAPGNLTALVNTSSGTTVGSGTAYTATKWYFESPQYSYSTLSLNGSNKTHSFFGWVGANSQDGAKASFGLFTSENTADYGNTAGENLAADWGHNTIYENSTSGSSYEVDYWHTPSSADWTYVLSTRSASTIGGKANSRYCMVIVNEIKGVIIFSDNFVWYTTSMGDAPTKCNTIDDYSTSYTLEQWNCIESAGAVFLPAVGYRNGKFLADQSSGKGRYWSSTVNNATTSQAIMFAGTFFNIPKSNLNRNYGSAVRLIHDVN